MLKKIFCAVLIFATFVFLRPSFAKTANSSGPKFTITSCLKEYVVLFDKIGVSAAEKKANESATSQLKQKCLDKAFIKNWKKILAQTDADPLLNSQDILESWKTEVKVQKLDTEKSSAQIILGHGDLEHCLELGLKLDGQITLITSSRLCAKN